MNKNNLQPPSSIESEMVILGMMLKSAEHNDLACQRLIAKDFMSSKTALIFTALQEMYTINKKPELPILVQHLKDSGNLVEAGGVPFIVECSDANVCAYDLDEYLDILIKKSMQREVMYLFQNGSYEAAKPLVDLDDLIFKSSVKLNEISRRKSGQSFYSMKQLLTGEAFPSGKGILERMNDLAEQRKSQGDAVCVGLPTGIDQLDKTLNGLLKTSLIVIAARPGVGKTTLAVQIAVDVGCKSKMPVAIFSLEMSAEQVELKILSHFSEIPLTNLMTGEMNGHIENLKKSSDELSRAPIYISYAPSPKVTDICREAKKLKELYDIKLIIIDYLQLISGGARFKNSESRVNEMTEISREIKRLAMELDIPIICLSQLNRSVESRASKRPMLSDLRESGSIEQDCDSAIFISRPDVDEKNKNPGKAILDVLKNRFGECKEVLTTLDLKCGTFKPYVDTKEEAIQEIKQYHVRF